jgi:hypothetical protein
MSARQQTDLMTGAARPASRRIVQTTILAVFLTLLLCSSSLALVSHQLEATYNGSEAPEGPFGLMFADATDNSTGPSAGDIYANGGFAAVDKLNSDGTYAGVQLTGEQTPQGSFSLLSFETLVTGAIAVDSSAGTNSGDIYVSDMEHGVVDKFSEAGKFICQITGAQTAKEIKEKVEKEIDEGVKATAPPEECALAGSGLAGSFEPAGVTVDSTTGDVWVSDRAHAAVDEFNAAGQLLSRIQGSHVVTPGPLAFDPTTGNLYITNGTSIFGDPKNDNVVTFHEGKFEVFDEHEPLSVAVDPASGHVYVFEAEGHTLAEYDSTGALIDRFVQIIEGEPRMRSVAVSSDGHIYGAESASAEPGLVVKYGLAIALPTVTTEASTGIVETGATLNGSVDPDAAHGGGAVTACNFEYVTQEAFEAHDFEGAAQAPCLPATPFSAVQGVTATVTLAPSTGYRFRLSASNANEIVSRGAVQRLTTPGPPIITSEKALPLTATGNVLNATIDPSSSEADCHVEYVDDATFQASGFADATVASCSPAEVPTGSTSRAVSAAVRGLTISTTYHYRFVSVNSSGPTHGLEQTFATFGVKHFSFEVLNKELEPYTQAGGHPFEWTTAFTLNTVETEQNRQEIEVSDANIRDVETELPPGLIANATATPRCARSVVALGQCSPATQVGEIEITEAGNSFISPLFNVVPPSGVPVELGGQVANLVRVYIDGNVRTGGDYGATAKVISASEEANVIQTRVTIWGVPADPSHDERRVCPLPGKDVPIGNEGAGPCPARAPLVPLLTNPTNCPGTPLFAHMRVDSWQAPNQFVSATPAEIPATTGCESLDFTPSITLAPDTSVADAPSGLNVNIAVPQNETPEGLASSTLENTSVALPAGVSVSPSASNGLQACSEAQIGLHSEAAPECPNASKIGTVEITSPLIADHLKGGVYVARQGENPFHSLLAMYIAAEADGARVKLAGHIVADPVTGQLTTTFTETPQIPFSDFELKLFGGHRGALATPESCGSPNTVVSLAPWSGLAATRFELPFTTNTGCVSGFSPAFEAGTVSAQAGAYSPFTLSFSRTDSEEDLAGATVSLPQGLIGKIAGVARCSDAQLAAAAANSGQAEQASPSCPAGSQIGTVQTTAGPGPSPVAVSGKAYLTGPYKGGPYGIAVVVPAVAGPFDLGTVVVRQSLHIDSSDAHVTDVSDPFPRILQGVPLRLKSVSVTLDRPDFTFNPTSCEAKTISATLESAGGAHAGVSSHYQAANCATLKFAPKFSASTAGKASKANGASLDVKVGYPTGPEGTYANIKAVKVDLPKQLPSRLTTLQKACLAATFEANPANCPKASNVGTATATTPVLNVPLTGPAYIVSHGGEAFPDLEIVLQGENVTLILVGNTQIKNGITSSTFKTAPDAPVSSFELKLPTGQFSILGANVPQSKKYNLCGQTLPMPTQITAQNGAVIKQTTKIAVTGCPKVKKAAKKKHGAAKVKKRGGKRA